MKQHTPNTEGAAGSPYESKPWRGSSHEITRRYAEGMVPGSRILDVGTATGLLGRALEPNRYHLCGIEPDTAWAGSAEAYYDEFFVGTLAQASTAAISSFDLVVCCDVLEHMEHPMAELKRLVDAQGSRTQFIVSVPNIAHIWVRLNLLLGRFDYTDRGIMDRTHLRFFTRKGFQTLLLGAGLTASRIQATPVPLELVHRFFVDSPIGRMLYGIQQGSVTAFPRLLGYQFICLAQRTEH